MPAADYATLKTIALVLFLAFWLVVVLRLITTRADRYADVVRIPLDEDDPWCGRLACAEQGATAGAGETPAPQVEAWTPAPQGNGVTDNG